MHYEKYFPRFSYLANYEKLGKYLYSCARHCAKTGTYLFRHQSERHTIVIFLKVECNANIS